MKSKETTAVVKQFMRSTNEKKTKQHQCGYPTRSKIFTDFIYYNNTPGPLISRSRFMDRDDYVRGFTVSSFDLGRATFFSYYSTLIMEV